MAVQRSLSCISSHADYKRPLLEYGVLGMRICLYRQSIVTDIVSRLAGLPKPILDTAQMRSSSLKAETQERLRGIVARRVGWMLHNLFDNKTSSSQVLRNVEMLHNSLSSSSISFSQ